MWLPLHYNDEKGASQDMLPVFDAAQLAALVRTKRAADRLTIRQAAQEAGVSAATISRVMGGNHLPDSDTLILLVRWLGVSLDEVTVNHEALADPKKSRSIPESLALLLHTDSSLRPEDADTLLASFRLLYDRLRQPHKEPVRSEARSQS